MSHYNTVFQRLDLNFRCVSIFGHFQGRNFERNLLILGWLVDCESWRIVNFISIYAFGIRKMVSPLEIKGICGLNPNVYLTLMTEPNIVSFSSMSDIAGYTLYILVVFIEHNWSSGFAFVDLDDTGSIRYEFQALLTLNMNGFVLAD